MPHRLPILFALFAAACHSEPASRAPDPASPRDVAVSTDYAIFPARLGEQVRWLGYTGASGYWTPDAEAVAALDADLARLLRVAAADPAAVDEFTVDRPESASWVRGEIALILERLPDYRRQYVGVVDGDGTRRILVRGFAGPAFDGGFAFERWREELAIVSDGGSWYWYAVYDPSEDRFVHFRGNGYA